VLDRKGRPGDAWLETLLDDLGDDPAKAARSGISEIVFP
jgi:hypothetical protein